MIVGFGQNLIQVFVTDALGENQAPSRRESWIQPNTARPVASQGIVAPASHHTQSRSRQTKQSVR